MMLARVLEGSIRRQIAVLAIGPVALLAILGTISEQLTLKDPESVSQARAVAMQIEMVLDMVRSAETKEQETVILNVVTKTGLQVEQVPAEELHGVEEHPELGDFRLMVEENLPPKLGAKLRSSTATGRLGQVLIARVDQHRALAFAPPPAVPDSWITDHLVNRVLAAMAISIPVILLSLYGAA
jgi:hypothetical protein